MRKIVYILLLIVTTNCTTKNETQFSDLALNDKLLTLEGGELQFKEVLSSYKGKKILIDVWASWCGDCIKGMPKIVELQKEYKDIVFLFISIDDSLQELKDGVKKYNVKGEHYLLPSKWKGDLGTFLDLAWIPRYLVIDEAGDILVFNEVNAKSNAILNALSN